MSSLPISLQSSSFVGAVQNNGKNSCSPFVRIQSPLPNLLGFTKPTFSCIINDPKNLLSHNRSRFCGIKSVKQEREAQISQVKDDIGDGSGSPSTSFLSFLCPLLKFFSAGDPSGERNYLLEEATSSLSTLARLPWGSSSLPDILNDKQKVDPPLPLQLFEFEACPFCRRVREALTELDLSVEIFPCPKGSIRHREMVRRLGGREQFPFLVDPNTGTSMYESSDIVKYLFQRYGGKSSPSFGILESTLVTGWVPTLLRAGRGMTLWKNAIKESPPLKLELFSYENNACARIVREALCELELPYILQNVGQGSRRAKLLHEISGSKQVPYLVDHNSGVKIGEYKKILSYLFQTYSALLCLVALAFITKIFPNPRRGPKPILPQGPKPWPVIGNLNLIGHIPHQSLHSLSKKYGEIVLLKFGNFPIIVASSPEIAKQFLKAHDAVFASRPPLSAGKLATRFLPPGPALSAGKYISFNYSDMGSAPYGPEWRQSRKIFSSEIFNAKSLESTEKIRVKESII
ncbi:Thioredoxin family protein [Striga hermonthica]|uniref:Thioredoxin family protein n=1 Tax=Striga hermonthica TaxID=68872 RepID=A0A9N7NUW5_STRHE|nr:Thioredoxin family protein [Striga hermonthica]